MTPATIDHRPYAISHQPLAMDRDCFNLRQRCSIKAGMRYLLVLIALLLAASGRAQTTDIHGTWTAELHGGKVFLQVRTSPPPDWNRSGDWDGGWNMGQTFDVSDISGLPGNDEHLTA